MGLLFLVTVMGLLFLQQILGLLTMGDRFAGVPTADMFWALV